MPHVGGKSAKKSSSSTKRHFTVVIGNKEHGLYVSSSPSSAARKAVSKLCATDKKKKVQFHIREITQGSKKKTYGPYLGEIEKLAKPIELKGRVIKYKPVAKLSGKKTKTGGAKKRGSVLVVEAKDGKITKKYITKKQADKHMKPRHKRLDLSMNKGMKKLHKSMKKGMKPLHKAMDKGMKKLHKSMRGGGIYECFTKIPHTNHNFKIENGPSDNEYTLTLVYSELRNNSILQTQLNEDNIKYNEFYSKLSRNMLIDFLNKNNRNMSFTLKSKEPKKTIYNIDTILHLLINYFFGSIHQNIYIKDNTGYQNEQAISMPDFIKRIMDKVNT